MHAFSQLRFDFLKCGPHAVAPTPSLELEGSMSGLAADEDEPQKRERLRFAEPAPFSVRRSEAAELQQPGLFRVQFEREPFEPRSHRIPESPRISFSLEARNDIVSVAHNDHLARSLSPAPLRRPEIEDLVQEDVGQQW